MRIVKRRIALLAALLATTLSVSACGGGGGEGGGDGAGATGNVELQDATLTVGSKEFTEQLILGQMAIQVLENAGAQVKDETGIVGTDTVRTALTSGQIDLYWDYTGTGWTSFLDHKATGAPSDPQELFQKVAQEDLAKNKIKWFALSPVNNSYAIATTADRAKQLGIATLSDYAELAKTKPQDASLCAATEFLTRSDGWPGVEKAYGFTLPKQYVSEVDLGIIFTQVPSGDRCKFGEVFSTDGRIAANDMLVLEDDKDFFVKYNLAMTTREEVFDKYPQLEKLFTPLAEKLTTETMQKLNAQVDAEGLPAKQVAQKWLEDNGFLD
ncbi:MAG: glycine/betaine ABC transporter substrate-binding protein [Intrasporangium sp.]|uniref:glycine betaine ABC transporter substrate-binding protein n=1 Tax=Intrasporangium sp. TaxID=1925024 RepID=UPI002647677B|nr:glycine betaine ABC transporter substrate-binding protein [Intrasporangium sp.]MDN5794418.1 glycine/betaine ABC transporter substrate-binding protein [Intrasporangium sp.]